MRAALLALASVLVPSPVAPAMVSPLLVVSPSAIVQVLCYSPKYISAGTAFRIGPTGLLLSVNHVTSAGSCFIAGKPINIAYKAPGKDFSELMGETGPYLEVDCGGFVKDRKYLAIGFARGLPTATTVELTATGEHDDNGEAILYGMVPVIPGQSGGPILDEETGRVVGVINAENFEQGLSWSVELKDSPICKQGIA